MSATYNDVMNKIADISVGLDACFDEIQAKGVTVPADSSLDDLAGLIRQIPDDVEHPDYSLPWVLADGTHGFITNIRQSASASNTVALTLELMPAADNTPCLYGSSNSQGGHDGMQQMTNGFRARFRLCTVNSNNSITVNENNYAGLNSQWSDSSYPYNKKLSNVYQSINSTSEYRAVLYNGIETITASASMAQPTSSAWPNYPAGILCRTQMVNEGTANASLKIIQPAVNGTKLYNVKAYSGPWSSKTLQADYNPVLHWDASWGKYRPCFVAKIGDVSTYTSYAVAQETFNVDSSVDGCYYVNTALGLTNISLTQLPSVINKRIYTIPYSTSGNVKYIANIRFGSDTTDKYDFITAGSNPQMCISMFREKVEGTSNTYKFTYRFYSWYGTPASSQKYRDFYTNSTASSVPSSYVNNFNVAWTPKSSGTYPIYRWSAGSTVGALTNGGTVTGTSAGNDAQMRLLARRYYYSYSGGTYYYGVNSLMAVDASTGEVLNYLVLCTYNDDIAYYDCITKTIYT